SSPKVATGRKSGSASTCTRGASRSVTNTRSAYTWIPLGRVNRPGSRPLPPVSPRRSPLSPSYTTSRWLDLAVAITRTWPSAADQAASESNSSSGLGAVTKRSGISTLAPAAPSTGLAEVRTGPGALAQEARRAPHSRAAERRGMGIAGLSLNRKLAAWEKDVAKQISLYSHEAIDMRGGRCHDRSIHRERRRDRPFD